eukprot:444969-Karenia_brevis.AAC.1
MSNKIAHENVGDDLPKRLKLNVEDASRQCSGTGEKRDVIVRTMSGRIVHHANLPALTYLAELYRAVVRHYPGKSVSLIYKEKPVKLQWKLESLA